MNLNGLIEMWLLSLGIREIRCQHQELILPLQTKTLKRHERLSVIDHKGRKQQKNRERGRGRERGRPGMVAYQMTVWDNCPVAWKGQYTRGDHGVPTVMLEAVASHDLWIWHAFFGVAGSNNDINVLNQSPLFTAQ